MNENLTPKIFRMMFPDDNGGPRVGSGPDMLGVRNGTDVHPDPKGNVGPGGGMSVAPKWHVMKSHRIPKRLGPQHPKGTPAATGRDDRCIWWMGEGPFDDGEVTSELRLHVTDVTQHGHVEPAGVMPLVEFSAWLAKTRDAWRSIPNDPWSVEDVYIYGQPKR